MLRSLIRTAFAAVVILTTLATTAHAQQRAEAGIGGGIPIAQDDHAKGTRFSGLIGGRVLWEREHGSVDAGVDLRPTVVSNAYYSGDQTLVDAPWILRTRIMVGARYSFVRSARYALFVRLGLGIEHRMSRYTLERFDPEPLTEHTTEQSTGPLVEPSIGLRLGGLRRYAIIELSSPTAVYGHRAITALSEGDTQLEVDAAVTIRIGWTL